MPADVYLKTTNYPARPYAGPGILCTPQLVPQACPPTLANYSIIVPMVGPGGGQGSSRGEAEGRGPLALPLPWVCPLPAPPSPSGGHWWWTLPPRAPSHSPMLQKATEVEGCCSAMPQGLGTAPTNWYPLLLEHRFSLPIQVLPYSPSWARMGCFHPQTPLSQPSTPSLLPKPRKG